MNVLSVNYGSLKVIVKQLLMCYEDKVLTYFFSNSGTLLDVKHKLKENVNVFSLHFYC